MSERTFRRIPFVLSVLTTLSVPAVGSALDVFGAGTPQPLTGDDLLVHRMDDEFYTESWYFMGVNADGTQFFIHYAVTNAGFGSFTGAVETTVILPDGKIVFAKDAKIAAADVKYAKDALNIAFGAKHALRGDLNGYQITSKGEQAGYQLTVAPLVPGVKFGDGRVNFDKDRKEFYALAVLAPKAKVTGTLVIDGRSVVIDAFGYADHAWQNYPGHKMADRLFSLRGFEADQSAAFLAFDVPGGGLIPTLIVTAGDQTVLATSQVTLSEAQHTADPQLPTYRIPGKLVIKGTAGGPAVTGEIVLAKQRQRQDAVADFSFFERTMIKMFVAKPILYRHDATWRFDIPLAGGGTKTYSGTGVVETMILRGE